MSVRLTAGRLLALAACASVAAAPFACGTAFSTGGGDTMAPDGATVEGGGDVTAAEGSADARAEVTGDGPVQVDGIAVEAAGPGTVQGTVVDGYLLPVGGIDVRCQGQKA